MSVANESVLEFLDLSLHINKQKKICVHIYAKPTNSFTYVLPSTCYSKRNLKNIPKGIALRLRRICDSHMRRDEFQNYQIATEYNIYFVKRQFHTVINISRSEARQVKQKVRRQNFNLVTVYNPMLNNLQKVIKSNLSLLYSDPDS